MISRMQSAPIARLSYTWQGSSMKSLRSTGRSERQRAGQELVLALEVRLVGQHREAGGAAALIGAGQRGRVEVGADQPLPGDAFLISAIRP